MRSHIIVNRLIFVTAIDKKQVLQSSKSLETVHATITKYLSSVQCWETQTCLACVQSIKTLNDNGGELQSIFKNLSFGLIHIDPH